MTLDMSSATGTASNPRPVWLDAASHSPTPLQERAPVEQAPLAGWPAEPFYHPQVVALQRLDALPDPSGSTSFDARVRGQQPKPIDMKLAEICQSVYDPASTGPAGWNRLDAAQLQVKGIDPASLEDPATGFRAGIYTDGQDHYVLAFAGSSNGKDWLNDIQQGLGLPAKQYDQAIALARRAQAAFGDNLVITGHSLGGGLAAAAAAKYGIAAVTFNAAGVHDDTLRAFGLDPAAVKRDADGGQIRAYSVDGEILSSLQDHRGEVLGALAVGGAAGALINPILGGATAAAAIRGLLHGDLPKALGHQITLADPKPVEKPKLQWYDWLWGDAEVRETQYAVNEIQHSVDEHMIGPVISALGAAHPDWPK